MPIVAINDELRPVVLKILEAQWGGRMMVTLGNLFDAGELPGFVMRQADGEVTGLVLYDDRGGDCEIAALYSGLEDKGNGSALLQAAIDAAKEKGCERVWLVTTNDNTRAIRFYQKRGFTLREVHINSLADARLLKPEIPATGMDGIPLRDEFEFEKML